MLFYRNEFDYYKKFSANDSIRLRYCMKMSSEFLITFFFNLELDSKIWIQIRRYSTELQSSVKEVFIWIFRAAALKFLKVQKCTFHLQPLFGFEGNFIEFNGNTGGLQIYFGKWFQTICLIVLPGYWKSSSCIRVYV